jgi:hypothetical protein
VTVKMTEEPEIHLIPYGDVPNTYIDVMEAMRGHEHIYVFRAGQTPEEFWAELEAAKVRVAHGLPPGRTMPTAEEIAAGPMAQPVIIPYGVFRARWRKEELEALFAAKKTDWRVEDYVTLALAQGHVNLSGPTAAEAKTLLVVLGVLSAERADAIFAV